MPPAVTVADVFDAWKRRGTPQALLPHGYMGKARALLAARAPDLLAAMYAAGAVDFDMGAFVPGGARLPEDDELRVLFCRRPLVESRLWEAALREPRIVIRSGSAARGLVFGEAGLTPRVCGVVTEDGAELRADLVVDAGGRRSPVWEWLRAAGARVPDAREEACGLVYYSRYYALQEGASFPKGPWLWGPRAELPYAMAIVHLADRGVFSVTLALPTGEHELRAIRDAAAFDAACAALPSFAPWVAAATARPISEVLMMGGLQNVLRDFVSEGEPVVDGLLPIGDTLCHTNAAYGWGVTLGAIHAFALVDALAQHPTDARARARSLHRSVAAENAARWQVSVEQDHARARAWRGEAPRPDDVPRAAALGQLAAAAPRDPRVFRAYARFTLLLDPAERLLGDRALCELARAATGDAAPARSAAPSRAELLSIVATAARPAMLKK